MDYTEPAVAIVKHMNPCGLAVAADTAIAYRMAYECDKVSAFGGIVATNRALDRDVASGQQVLGGAQARGGGHIQQHEGPARAARRRVQATATRPRRPG